MILDTLNADENYPSQLQPIYCATVGVGIGKTEAAIQLIIAWGGSSQNKSKNTEMADSQLRVIYAVPTHKLGDELVERFEKVNVTAGVWRGRTAKNPAEADSKMCLKPEAIIKASAARLSLQQSMCYSKNKNVILSCEYFSCCPYQRQADGLSNKTVVIVPHQSLFYKMPNIGARDLLIIDESFWRSGLRGL